MRFFRFVKRLLPFSPVDQFRILKSGFCDWIIDRYAGKPYENSISAHLEFRLSLWESGF